MPLPANSGTCGSTAAPGALRNATRSSLLATATLTSSVEYGIVIVAGTAKANCWGSKRKAGLAANQPGTGSGSTALIAKRVATATAPGGTSSCSRPVPMVSWPPPGPMTTPNGGGVVPLELSQPAVPSAATSHSHLRIGGILGALAHGSPGAPRCAES